jgi:allophanate hydrolase subunit 1
MTTLILIVAAAIGVFLLGGTKVGQLIKGFFNLFIQDAMSTPKGAEAAFAQKIEQTQNRVVQATETLETIAGQFDMQKRRAAELTKQLAQMERNCEALAQQGRFDEVELFAQQRDVALEEKEECDAAVVELQQAVKEAQEVVNVLEGQLQFLEREKVRVVNSLLLNGSMIEARHALDNLRKTNLDKLVAMAKDGAQKKQAQAAGSKIVHESRLSTRIAEAEKRVRQATTSDYVSQLKAKYGKPQPQ